MLYPSFIHSMLYPLLLIYKGGVWAAPLTETDMQLVLVGTGGCAGDDLRGWEKKM